MDRTDSLYFFQVGKVFIRDHHSRDGPGDAVCRFFYVFLIVQADAAADALFSNDDSFHDSLPLNARFEAHGLGFGEEFHPAGYKFLSVFCNLALAVHDGNGQNGADGAGEIGAGHEDIDVFVGVSVFLRAFFLNQLVAGSNGSCEEKVHGGGDFCDPVCELADGAADLRMAFCLGIEGIGRSHLPAGCNEDVSCPHTN